MHVFVCVCVYMHVLVCVCVYMHVHVRKGVTEMTNINKYKQNRDDVTCNAKVEIEPDDHSDVKQIVK